MMQIPTLRIATRHASDWRQRHIDHWNRTGKCLRHYSIDIPPLFCEQCGKPWSQVMDGREGRARRRLAQRGRDYNREQAGR